MTFLLNRWVQLGAALALAWLFFSLWGAEREKGKAYRVAAEAAAQAANGAVVAANANANTIDGLVARINNMVDGRRKDEAIWEQVVGQLEQEAAAAKLAAQKARRERDTIFRSTPSCEALGKLDLDGACPALASRLRALSGPAAPGSGEAGRSPSGGGEAPSRSPHHPTGVSP